MRLALVSARYRKLLHTPLSMAVFSLVLLPAFVGFGAARAWAESAWVRVSQVGYETGGGTARAYLMSTAAEPGATFSVLDARGTVRYNANVGALLGTWGHSGAVTYQVYALDFPAGSGQVPNGRRYTITVKGAAPARSPVFAVEPPSVLYPSELVNSLFFYETARDGPNYIPNALRDAPGHLKDQHADRFEAPPLDVDDNINVAPPAGPLVSAKLPAINASGGWWDAGDYIKYVETMSYAVTMMETGVRDFPRVMGPGAPPTPPPPPNAISYAGTSGKGAPKSSDFTAEARFGVDWLLRMWDRRHRVLSLQVDNSQEWNFYGSGDTASTACGGTYSSPYCLITEYDIWALPQAADTYLQPGDPEPCDPYTTFFICNRPVFLAEQPGAKIAPNLAGRLAAAFALCFELNRWTDPGLAGRCLRTAEEIYAMADTSLPDPSPNLLTAVPSDGYPETVWEDDMEWGATELARALTEASWSDDLPTELPVREPAVYLRDATRWAAGYAKNITATGAADTLNLYDVSGLAHFELVKALRFAPGTRGLAMSAEEIEAQLLRQVDAAVAIAKKDPWGYGQPWNGGDVTSHGTGLSVMASEAYALTGADAYNVEAQRWLGNMLGANAWGSSFFVGEGTTFPNCIQHQVANLAGSLDGTGGGTPVLWGAAVEGPSPVPSSGLVGGMRACPANGVDTFARFNGNPGPVDPNAYTRYTDNVQSYTTTEPAIDLTASSMLMWSWRLEPQILP